MIGGNEWLRDRDEDKEIGKYWERRKEERIGGGKFGGIIKGKRLI